MRNNDIDVCVVSETHLKPAQPDAVVNIADYAVFPRDRNWSGKDMRLCPRVPVHKGTKH